MGVDKMRHTGGAWREPGQSWMEHEQNLFLFQGADRQQSQQKLLYDLRRQIMSELSTERQLSTDACEPML